MRQKTLWLDKSFNRGANRSRTSPCLRSNKKNCCHVLLPVLFAIFFFVFKRRVSIGTSSHLEAIVSLCQRQVEGWRLHTEARKTPPKRNKVSVWYQRECLEHYLNWKYLWKFVRENSDKKVHRNRCSNFWTHDIHDRKCPRVYFFIKLITVRILNTVVR